MATESNKNQKCVVTGSTVKIKFSDGNIREFTIVPTTKTDPSKGLISNESPLGRALMGASAGEKRKYAVGDREFEVEVMEITEKAD